MGWKDTSASVVYLACKILWIRRTRNRRQPSQPGLWEGQWLKGLEGSHIVTSSLSGTLYQHKGHNTDQKWRIRNTRNKKTGQRPKEYQWVLLIKGEDNAGKDLRIWVLYNHSFASTFYGDWKQTQERQEVNNHAIRMRKKCHTEGASELCIEWLNLEVEKSQRDVKNR